MAASLVPAQAATIKKASVTWKAVSQDINDKDQYVYDTDKTDATMPSLVLSKSSIGVLGYIDRGIVQKNTGSLLVPNWEGWWHMKGGWKQDTDGPVSYTHLDVYKRQALILTYEKYGITYDNASLYDVAAGTYKKMPVLSDLYDVLKEMPEGTKRLCLMLNRFVHGSFASLNQQTNIRESEYMVFDVSDIQGEFLTALMYTVLELSLIHICVCPFCSHFFSSGVLLPSPAAFSGIPCVPGAVPDGS